MAAVSEFPKLVVLALAYAVKYLAAFRVEDCLRETKFFAKFTERTHMLLNGNTLTNLCVPSASTLESLLQCAHAHGDWAGREIYRNQTDYTTKGSLMWILDQTSTKFGARMLRSWVGRPLVDMRCVAPSYRPAAWPVPGCQRAARASRQMCLPRSAGARYRWKDVGVADARRCVCAGS